MNLARKEQWSFVSIDELLGDGGRRYFGHGFRKVSHQIRDVFVDNQKREVTAVAEIRYPAEWSRKKEGELRPHLSSLDAVLLSTELGEGYLREAYGLGDEEARRIWLRRCTLKAGGSPTNDLQAIPASLRLLGTEVAANSDGGYRSQFASEVGGMAVEFALDHPVVETRSARKVSYCSVDDLVGDAGGRYYGERYKDTFLEIRGVEVCEPEKRVTAHVEAAYRPTQPPISGAGAAFYPFVSSLEAVICFGQLAQVMLYTVDGITREQSRTLWMRKVVIRDTLPMGPLQSFDVSTRILKSSTLIFNGKRWRTATLDVEFPGMKAEYSVAHELP
jgi:hypothetical protein